MPDFKLTFWEAGMLGHICNYSTQEPQAGMTAVNSRPDWTTVRPYLNPPQRKLLYPQISLCWPPTFKPSTHASEGITLVWFIPYLTDKQLLLWCELHQCKIYKLPSHRLKGHGSCNPRFLDFVSNRTPNFTRDPAGEAVDHKANPTGNPQLPLCLLLRKALNQSLPTRTLPKKAPLTSCWQLMRKVLLKVH